MKEQRNNSFLQRIGERKKQCPPWQGNTLAQSTEPNSLKEWIDQLDELFDYLLSELDPYQRVLHAISFDGNKYTCQGSKLISFNFPPNSFAKEETLVRNGPNRLEFFDIFA